MAVILSVRKQVHTEQLTMNSNSVLTILVVALLLSACGGVSTSNTTTSTYTDNVFINNNLFAGSIPNSVISAWPGSGNTLAWYESNHPTLFVNDIEQNPVFESESNLDFTLKSSSPMIDSGRFLTSTSGSGTGTTINVIDASFFYDGFGIPGELGDLILLEGETNPLRIVTTDYASIFISVDINVTWTNILLI
jgi:hypothetical protein